MWEIQNHSGPFFDHVGSAGAACLVKNEDPQTRHQNSKDYTIMLQLLPDHLDHRPGLTRQFSVEIEDLRTLTGGRSQNRSPRLQTCRDRLSGVRGPVRFVILLMDKILHYPL